MVIALTTANSFAILVIFYMFLRILSVKRKEKHTYWTLFLMICYAIWSIACFFTFVPTGADSSILFFTIVKYGFSYLSIPVSLIIICLYTRCLPKDLHHLYYIIFISFVIYGLFSFKYFPVSLNLTEYWYGWGLTFPMSNYYLHTTVIIYLMLFTGALLLYFKYKRSNIKREKKDTLFLLIFFIVGNTLMAFAENVLPSISAGAVPATGNLFAPIWAFTIYRIIAGRTVLNNTSYLASKINLPMIIIDKDLNILSLNDTADDFFRYCLDSEAPSIKSIIADRYISFSKFTSFLEDPLKNYIEITLFTADKTEKQRHRFIITKADNYSTGLTESSYLLILNDVSMYMDQMKSLKAKTQEKELLLQEIHHRVKNNLQMIISLINFNLNNPDSADDSLYIDLINRIRTIQQAHETIYSAGDLDLIPMKNYLTSLIDKVQKIFSSSKQIDISAEIDDIFLSQKKAINIGIIVNEIICNAYKYAFADMHIGRIELSFTRSAEFLILMIKDNGCGSSKNEGQEHSYSIGMNIINGIAYQLNAELMKTNVSGTEYSIKIPADDAGNPAKKRELA